MSTGTDVQRQIRQARISRALFTVAAVLLLAAFAQHLASGALVLAAMNGLAVVLFAASVVLATARIRLLRKTLARELARPRMTLEDWRHLREMELELGWEPSEFPPGMTVTVQPAREARPVPGTMSASCPRCDQVHARESTGPARRYCPECEQQVREIRKALPSRRPTVSLSGTGSLSARAAHVPGYAAARTDDEIAAARAAIHFETLARVGLEHCLSYCPICLYRLFGPMPDGVKPAASISMWRWTEENWGWKR